MKKVLFVATVTKHINTFHIPYLKWFKEQGYEVHVASNGEEKIEYCDKHFNLPFERFPLKIKNIKVYNELKKIINDNEYEIIHCHTPVGGALARLAARKARKKYNTKVIYTAHGFHFYKGAPALNWIIYYPIEKILAKYTDYLITITNEDYELAKKKLKKIKHIEYVNGVGLNTERFCKKITDEEKKELKKGLNIKQDEIVLSYVAELNKNKNQKKLIDTVELLKRENLKIKLLLIGKGNQEEEYKKIIQNKNLQDNILLLGKRQDIPNLLSITDIYVASSIREGLPVNIMEAMYMGLPIVASNNRGHRELITNNENGFIVDSVEDLANKVKQLVQDNTLRINLGNNGKLKVEKYYIENVLQSMKKVYNDCGKIKILHILNSNKYSGAENVVIQIINFCKEEGIECTYSSPNGTIKDILENEKIKFLPIRKINISQIRKILKEEKPTLIHTHDFTAGILTAFSGTKIPIISHIHNNSPWIKRFCLKSIIYYLSTFRYKKILTVSNSIENEYIFGKKISNKIDMIGNPINLNNIIEKSKEENTKNEKYDIIFLGRLSEAKNPIRFIEIMKKIVENNNDISIAMIGDGELRDKCMEKIKAENLTNNIKMLGFLSNPYTILKNAKLLCITSNWEGYGLVAIESITLGVPVIANNVGGLPDIIDDSCGKIVNSNNEFEHEIQMLLDNEAILQDKKNGAKGRAIKLFTECDYKTKILKIYEEIIGEKINE